MENRRSSAKHINRWLIASIIGGITSLVLVATVMAATSAGTPPPSKATQVQQEMAAQATAAAKSPHATKQPKQTVASCPEPSGGQATIVPRSNIDPAAARSVNITNGATIPPSQGRPFDYLIIAGALQNNPQQGVLVVIRQPKDPCAQGPQGQTKLYNSPFQQGALTLTQISGDTVSFTTAASGTAAGGTGQFNYITGQFN